MFKNKGLTRVEVIVMVAVLGLLSTILLAVFQSAMSSRRTASQMKEHSPVRIIIQGCIIYAQGNSAYYPGIQPNGDNDKSAPPSTGYTYSRNNDAHTIYNGYILTKLLQGGYISPDYAISPAETKPGSVQKPPSPTDNAMVTVYGTNSSFAFLKVGDPVADAGRRAEWKDNSNGLAVVVTDRWNGQGGLGNTLSIHTIATGDATNNAQDAKNWRGWIGWNDNHAEFGTTAILAQTKYDKSANVGEGLFSDSLIDSSVPGATCTPGANAFMQYTTW